MGGCVSTAAQRTRNESNNITIIINTTLTVTRNRL